MVSGVSCPAQLGESVLGEEQETVLRITADCRHSLSRFSLYEAGMCSSEASTKAIAHRVCLFKLDVSIDLLRQVSVLLTIIYLRTYIFQALTRLHEVSLEVQWGGNSVHMDFIRLQLDLDDELLAERLRTVLTLERVGLAHVVLQERCVA
jgi:hypothetical protein